MSSFQQQVPAEEHISIALVPLFKGVLYRENAHPAWNCLLHKQAQLSDYVAQLGLDLIVDESEGFAYLKSSVELDREESQIPRLVARRQLSFQVSLLLALLRKRLAEHDASGTGERLILTLDDILQMMKVFLPDGTNEAGLVERIETDLGKVENLGFVRQLRNENNIYEVCRILKNFVDANWLAGIDQLLAEYLAYVKGERDE